MNKIPISVILAICNEENLLEGALRSVSWADEIIVVDGSSTDRSFSIAEKSGAKVVVALQAPAEVLRLKGVAMIRNSWFMFLDADERVTQELAEEIRKAVVSKGEEVAYRLLRRNYYQNRPVHLHHPDYQIRLFHKSQIPGLPDRIHRIPQIRGKMGILNGELIHMFFLSVAEYLNKLNRYTELESSYSKGLPPPNGMQLFKLIVFKPIGRFLQYYFLKKGILDGFFGFFYSVSSAYYDFVVGISHLLKPDPRKDKKIKASG